MVIRFATIMPEAFDLRRTAKQLEELSQMLHKSGSCCLFARLSGLTQQYLARSWRTRSAKFSRGQGVSVCCHQYPRWRLRS